MSSHLIRNVRSGIAATTGRTRRAVFAAALGTAMILPQAAPVLARGPESLADLAERVMPAVVNIKASQTVTQRSVPMPQLPPGSPFEDLFNDFFNRRQGPQGGQPQPQQRSSSLGSGFIIDASGIVVTNNHVIADANQVTVVLNDGTELAAEVLGKDSKVDLAVLRVKTDRTLKSVKWGDSRKARVGDWVMAIGNPFGFGGSVSAGIVSATDRNIRSGPYDNFIQTDAAINKGNSGGPLFNMDGDVIGVNTAIISPTGGSIGIGFAVPSAMAMGIVEQLQQFGETRRGWLGVAIQDVDDALAESLGIGKARGAFVSSVDEKGPAKPAGIEREDVIIRFDGKDVRSSRDLPRIVAETPVDKVVDVVVMRGGKEVVRQVKVGRLEDGDRRVSSAPSGGAQQGATPRTVLGLDLSPMSPDLRRRYNIKDSVDGVVVTRVQPGSRAAERMIQAGDVVVEVQRTPVKTVADLTKRLDELKAEKRANALFYVANANGDLRYITLPVE
jgi:serine protease Do